MEPKKDSGIAAESTETTTVQLKTSETTTVELKGSETTTVQLKASETETVSKNVNDAPKTDVYDNDKKKEADNNTKLTHRIEFDFFLNISPTIATEEKIKSAVCKSVDIEPKQILQLLVADAGSDHKDQVRITGVVGTDDWEIRTLGPKFERLVPDRILSASLKDALGLEDRPRVSRFYSRQSNTLNPPTNNAHSDSSNQAPHSPSAGTVRPGEVKPTASLRTAKAPDSASGLKTDQSDLRPKPTDEPDKPTQHKSCCVVL